jgi:pyridoxamine 5'-phosphate oxidase family protein
MARTDHPSATYLRIKPIKKWSWGIEGPVFVQGKFNVKRS